MGLIDKKEIELARERRFSEGGQQFAKEPPRPLALQVIRSR
jgi:hypothetical protein